MERKSRGTLIGQALNKVRETLGVNKSEEDGENKRDKKGKTQRSNNHLKDIVNDKDQGANNSSSLQKDTPLKKDKASSKETLAGDKTSAGPVYSIDSNADPRDFANLDDLALQAAQKRSEARLKSTEKIKRTNTLAAQGKEARKNSKDKPDVIKPKNKKDENNNNK